MLKKYKESLRKILKRFVWWQPVLFVILMFAIGLYTNYKNKSDSSLHQIVNTAVEAVRNENSVGEETDVGDNETEFTQSLEESNPDLHENGGSEAELTNAEENVDEEEQGDEDSLVSDNEDTNNKKSKNASKNRPKSVSSNGVSVKESGTYTSKEELALYIYTYNKLPSNFITKDRAKERGWNPHSGNLHKVLKGMSIGGDYFGNREGNLPKKRGRKYYECDVDYTEGFRNEKRIVFSNDGLIFYTEDHYETFEQLY